MSIKLKELELEKRNKRDIEKKNEEKLANLRQNMRESEKSIFEKIEKEYSPILKQKDELIKDQ